jgi:hypothetical protein
MDMGRASKRGKDFTVAGQYLLYRKRDAGSY